MFKGTRRALMLCCTLFCLASPRAQAGETPWTGRTWEYLNLTAMRSPRLAFTVQPGHRLEFLRVHDPNLTSPKGTFLYEFFAGPVVMARAGSFSLKLPVWYYYMGFPIQASRQYFSSHSLEVVPIAEYRRGPFRISNRIILHNTLYSSFYTQSNERWGYSCLLRELFSVNASISPKVSLGVGEEIFVGLVEDQEAMPAGPGFARAGFSENRLYLGPSVTFEGQWTLSPQYVYDTQYNEEGDLTETAHYFFLTLSHVIVRERKPPQRASATP